jgi:hypothetical protein
MKVLFFSPHAYFTVHALPEALVAENLAYKGAEIVSVNCNSAFKKHCLCMSQVEYSDDVKKKAICRTCQKNRDHINKAFSLRSLNIDDYLDKEEKPLIKQHVEALDPENYMQFNIDGVPIAQFALYEFWLNHKLSSTKIPTQLWQEYLALFENALITFYAMSRIMRLEMPDRLTTYNSLYSVNRVACAIADLMHIPHFTLHAGPHHVKRIQQMTIFRGIATSALINRKKVVEYYRKTPCTGDQINLVASHVVELFNATSPWVYSIKHNKTKSADLRKRLKIDENQKTLLAVMRSNDERLAAKLAGMDIFNAVSLFSNQIEWLQWLAEFARTNPQFAIIFRVHPREFPNKREQVTSENAIKLLEFIDTFDRPENLHINLPDDKISLHDLLKITDVMLNNSSTAGLEGALFGIPVIGIGDDLYSFDLTLQKEASSRENYIALINQSVKDGWSISRVIAAHRWLNYLFSEVSVNISDGYKLAPIYRNRWLKAMYRVMIKTLKSLNLIPTFSEVASRAIPLKNANSLTYAIMNNEESHIGLDHPREQGEVCNEKSRIIAVYNSYMKLISSTEDSELLDRIKACINN